MAKSGVSTVQDLEKKLQYKKKNGYAHADSAQSSSSPVLDPKYFSLEVYLDHYELWDEVLYELWMSLNV